MLIGVLVAKRMRELGVDLPIYSITVDADIIAAAKGAYENMTFLTFLTPTGEFKTRYEEKYGITVDIGADSAYDAVMLIADAIKNTGSTDTKVLQEYLNNITKYQGASGSLISDGKGGFTKDLLTKKVVSWTAVDL